MFCQGAFESIKNNQKIEVNLNDPNKVVLLDIFYSQKTKIDFNEYFRKAL